MKDGVCWLGGGGGWKVGRVKWYIGMGVWIGGGASGRRIREGVV